MDDKMDILFDPKKINKSNDSTIYEKIFEVRKTRPNDFVISSLFSAFMDAKTTKTKVYVLKTLSHERIDNVIFDFKRCKIVRSRYTKKKHSTV